MKPPVSKSRSSPYLGARAARADEGDNAGPCEPGTPRPACAASAAIVAWAAGDSGGRSMPLLPRPTARLSLCMDFPGYLQALQHDTAAVPLGLRHAERALRLSAVDPTSRDPEPQHDGDGDDPRARPPPYLALPPGFSLGSLAGAQKDERVGGGCGGGPSDRQFTRRSVDAAVGAELLATMDLSQCSVLPLKELDGNQPSQAVNGRSVTQRSAASSPQHLPPAAAATKQALRSPPAPPPQPSPERQAQLADAVVSQSQLLLQTEWNFDSDLQRARVQARYTALQALDEVWYEAPDGEGSSHSGGAAIAGSSGVRRSASGKPAAGGGTCGGRSGSSSNNGACEDLKRKGLAQWLCSAFKRRMLCVADSDKHRHRDRGRDRASDRQSRVGSTRGSGGGGGGSGSGSRRARREPSGGRSLGAREPGEDAGAEVGDASDEVDADAEGPLVQRSRDSRLVHRVRLAMDVARRPNGGPSSGPQTGNGRNGSRLFAGAGLVEPSAAFVGVADAAAAQRRVWFRVPLVDRTHWFTRSRDYRSGSSDYGEEARSGGSGGGGGGLSMLRIWSSRRSQEQPAAASPSGRSALVASSGPVPGRGSPRADPPRSESFSEALRRRSRRLLILASRAMVTARRSAADAEPSSAAAAAAAAAAGGPSGLSRRSSTPWTVPSRSVW